MFEETDLIALYSKYKSEMDDPWRRRINLKLFSDQVDIFGCPVILNTNLKIILEALHLSNALFSNAPRFIDHPFVIEIICNEPPDDPGPIPENLFDLITYTGGESWLNFQFAAWGNCFIDLETKHAKAVICESFARRRDLISRCMLNTIITNFFIASGFGMLHTSCLVKNDQALLLMAPHGSGKSTAALNLLHAGYSLLTDSMVFINQLEGRVFLNGFPTGRIKLRRDMLPYFPHLEQYIDQEFVRGEVKYVVNLWEYEPTLVLDQAICPSTIHLCLLKLNSHTGSYLERIDEETSIKAIMENSLYFDKEEIWIKNLTQIKNGLSAASTHQLNVGLDENHLVQVVNQLLSDYQS